MEREVVSCLKFKLMPDTLYFWFDLSVKLWDLYVSQEGAWLGYRLYKPQEVSKDLNKYEPGLHEFRLG